MKNGLTIVKKGKKPQVLVIESLNEKDYEIFFRNDEFSDNIVINLCKKDFKKYPLLWEQFCKLADQLRPMVIAFVSEDNLVPKTSLLITGSGDKITINCFSIGGDDGTLHPPIRLGSVIVSAKENHPRNLATLPSHLNPEDFKFQLCSILDCIVNFDYNVEITS